MRRRLNRLRLDKIAAVDDPCQEHATVAIIKRAPDAGPPAIAKKTFEEALRAQLVSEQISCTFWRAFENQWAVRDAFREALTDEIAAGGDGTTAVSGFTDAMEQIATLAAEAAREAANASDATLESAVEEAISKWLESKESPMKITNKAALKAAVAAFNPETSPFGHVAIIQKAATDLGAEDELPAEGPLAKAAPPQGDAELRKRIALLEMPADVRKHYDALPAAEQDGFLAKTADERVAIVAKANEADPVLYTTKSGREIRKSHGQLAADLARDNDELRGEVATMKGDLTANTLEKRAAAYPNVAAPRAMSMLKAADALGVDTDDGKAVIKSLADMNQASSRLFKSVGSEDPSGGDVAKGGDPAAVTEFNAAVEALVDTAKGVGRADAMSKARAANPDLFKRAFPDAVEPADEDQDAA